MNKKESQQDHFRARIRKRFGVVSLGYSSAWEIRNEILSQIKTKKAVHVKSQPNGKNIKIVYLDQKHFAIVYDSGTNEVVTIFPDDSKYHKIIPSILIIEPILKELWESK